GGPGPRRQKGGSGTRRKRVRLAGGRKGQAGYGKKKWLAGDGKRGAGVDGGLIHVLAAVDRNLGARDVGGLGTAQGIDRGGALGRRAETLQGDARDQLIGAGRQDRGVDLAGANRVDPDAETGEIGRELARERPQRRLRGAVRAAGERVHAVAGDRSDVDDRALALLQALGQRAREVHRREEVDREHLLPEGEVAVQAAEALAVRALGREAGVVDQEIGRASWRGRVWHS